MQSDFRYLEDLTQGERWTSAPLTLNADDIIQFGKLYDPQTFHTDPAAADSTPFKGLVASGWHLAALAMRLSVAGRPFGATPIIGMGVDELRWLKPVRPGDTLTLEREFTLITPPTHPRGRGTVHSRMVLRNQHREDVMVMTALSKVPTRPG
jgi:acyl dehydratase